MIVMEDEKELTREEMWQKRREARLAAKALQRKLKTITDPVERKRVAKQMNDLFSEACIWFNKVKRSNEWERCVEREFILLESGMEND